MNVHKNARLTPRGRGRFTAGRERADAGGRRGSRRRLPAEFGGGLIDIAVRDWRSCRIAHPDALRRPVVPARPGAAIATGMFNALHRRGTVSEAMMHAFGLLELDGEDLRDMPLGDRKKRCEAGAAGGSASSSASIRSLSWRSPASRRDGRHIHFHAPPLPDGAIAVKMNRLDKPGQTDDTTGVVQREQRYR
jgi:hypothetical protein